MKKYFVFVFAFFCAAALLAQNAVPLDTAIKNSMNYLAERLKNGSKVVILNFNSPAPDLSNYVIEELTSYIVNDGKLTVVDRRNLELLQQEMNFQLSGEVSDETAQSIGQKLGAQFIISGSMTSLGNMYRMRVQVIAVETAQIAGMLNTNVSRDETLSALLGETGPAGTPAAPVAFIDSGTNDQNAILNAAKESILDYFKRYKPKAVINGNTVNGEAKFGRYPVTITITAQDGAYNIDIESNIDNSYIEKWKANINNRIARRLPR